MSVLEHAVLVIEGDCISSVSQNVTEPFPVVTFAHFLVLLTALPALNHATTIAVTVSVQSFAMSHVPYV